MNQQIAHCLDGIEIYNRALNDICHAFINLSQSNMTAKQLQAVIKPLAESMGDYIDESNQQALQLEALLNNLSDNPFKAVQP